MKITNLKIRPIGHPDIKLTWDYEVGYLDNTSNHLLKIAFSENDTGPFQPLVELPINTVDYVFKQPNIKYLEFVFFELTIFNTFTGVIEHVVVAGTDKPANKFSDKIESKYNLLLKRRIGNKVLFFKRKKAGHHCRKCWDYINARLFYDSCDVCFETGYGNNSLIGMENFHLDGILKNNIEGYLEFYKKDYTFNFYKLDIADAKDVENAGLQPGDIFQVVDAKDNIIYTAPIRSLTHNGFILEDTTTKEFSNLENYKFNVFKYEPTVVDNLLIDFKIIKTGNNSAKVFYRNNFLLADQLLMEGRFYPITELTPEYLVVTGDIENIYKASEITVLNNDVVVDIITPKCSLYVENALTAKIFTNGIDLNLKKDSHFFITYYYDGINRFKVEDKQFIVGENTIPGKTPGLYSLTTDTIGDTFELKLETLSNYEKIFSNDSQELFIKVFTQLFQSNIYLEIKTLNIRKALEQLEVYLKPNTKFLLPHKNILKEYFRGCGVLAINLLTGKTYRGQNWSGGYVQEDFSYDFFVDPETGELNTLSLPQGNYEIKYVFLVKDIQFASVFNWSTNDFTFIHPALKNITLPENIILAVGTNKSYQEFSIKKHYPTTGKLVLELNNIDNRLFFDTIGADTRFSLDYPASGGYYVAEESYINYINDTPRALIPTDSGVNRIEKKSAIIGMDIQLNTGDLVYDILSAKFFSVDMVNENSFKGRGTHQNLQLTILSFNRQAALNKLLNR